MENQLNILKGLTCLSEKVRLYVPSNVAGTVLLDRQAEMVKETEQLFSALFGGATSYDAVGSYVMADGTLVREKIVIVESSTDQLDNEKIDEVIMLAQEIIYYMRQEAVSLEINGKLYFIED